MAGQDLLDQRAAGTGHAEHEDRNWRRIAHAAEAIQQAGVEHVGNGPENLLTGRFIVIDFAALEGIALEQMLEGAAIVADVFERLAEREVDVQHLAGRQTVGVGGQRLERGEIGIAGAKGLQIRAIVMRFGIVGPRASACSYRAAASSNLPCCFSALPRLLCASARSGLRAIACSNRAAAWSSLS